MTDLSKLSDAELDALERQLSQQRVASTVGDLSGLSDEELDALEAQITAARPEPLPYQRLYNSGFPGAQTLVGGLKGFADVFQTLNQGAAEVTDAAGWTDGRADRVEAMNNAKNAEYEGTRGPDAGFDWGRLGGQIGATAPLGAVAPVARAGFLGEAVNGGIQGALGAAAVSSANEEPLENQMAVGGFAGMTAPPLVRMAGRGVAAAASPVIDAGRRASDYITGNISAALGSLSSMSDDLAAIRKGLAAGLPEARDALQSYLEERLQSVGQAWHELMPDAQASLLRQAEATLRGTGDMTPEMLARRADMDALGVEGTAGAITRDPRIWQFEQNTAGVAGAGDGLVGRFRQDNQRLVERLNELARGTGGRAASPYEAGERSVEAVQGKWQEMQGAVSDLYRQIRETVGDDIGMKPSQLLTALDEHADEAAADSVVTSVRRRLQRLRVIDKDGAPTNMQLTVSEAEELRKFVNRLSDGNDPAVQRIKRSLITAVDDDVFSTTGADAFRDARQAAANRFAEFEPRTLKNVVDEKTVADDVLKRNVLGAKVADLNAFRRSLTTGTPEQVQRGSQAWNDLRMQTLEHIIRQSTDAGGKLQGSRLAKALDGIGNERLRIIFTPEELAQLGTIRRVAHNTTVAVPESRVNYSGTGAFLADLLGRMGVGKAVQKVAQGTTNLPVVGPALAPVTGLASAAGKVIDEAAVNAAVGRALNATPEAVQQVMSQAGRREQIIEYLRRLPASPAAAEAINMLTMTPANDAGGGEPLRVTIGRPRQ